MELSDFPFVSLDVPERYCEEPRGTFDGIWQGLARPSTDDELRAILRFANEKRVPIVPYGGGTGLVGGQIYPEASGAICLSMEKFNRHEAQDGAFFEKPFEHIRAGAGVILDDLHEALRGSGYRFPLHIASSGSAQIGGLISTNAGGINAVRFGTMADLTLGVRGFLADGRMVDGTSDLRKDNTGWRVDRLLIGSEGSLGVIAEAKLRLVREDVVLTTCLAEVASPEMAYGILQKLKARDEAVNAFELISKTSWQIREEGGFDATPIGTPEWSILVELAGGVDAFEAVAGDLGKSVIAMSEKERADLWQMRETIPLANRVVGSIASHDIAVRPYQISEFVTRAGKNLRDRDVRINCFGHMGDGNLHYNIFPGKGRDRQEYDAARISEIVYKTVAEMGGSISAEHGIGRIKAAMMRRLGQGEKLDIMRDVKAALDPNGVINPGVYE